MQSTRKADTIEGQIGRIQESTRSSRLLLPVHEWLRLHSKLYYRWHLGKSHIVVQWIVLILVFLVELTIISTLVISLLLVILLASYNTVINTFAFISKNFASFIK